MSFNPINSTYSFENAYHQQDQNGSFSKTVRVTATTNNPLTLTGSYANNAGFLIMNTSSISILTSNGTVYAGSNFYEAGQANAIFPIQLSYVSASATGDVTILYY